MFLILLDNYGSLAQRNKLYQAFATQAIVLQTLVRSIQDASTRMATKGIKPLTLRLETASLTHRPIPKLFLKSPKQQIIRALPEPGLRPRILLRMLEIKDLLLTPFIAPPPAGTPSDMGP